MYRSHDCNDVYLDKVMNSISKARQALVSLNCSSMLVNGDFNLSHTWYGSLEADGDSVIVSHVKDEWPTYIKFQTCLERNHLTQFGNVSDLPVNKRRHTKVHFRLDHHIRPR